MTTNKTDFYREPEHFAFLQRTAVPQLLAERRNARLKVWSAACSNGAEPYTLAMLLADMAQRLNFQFAILGTDISTQVLETAVTGIYPKEMIAPVPSDVQQRYVMRPRDRNARAVRIVPELRRLVTFMRLNLIDQSYPIDRDVDVIFCRNVLIYFAHQTQQAVISRLARHLRPGGFLFLGHSDCVSGDQYSGLRPVAVTVFQGQ
jgi:chemotaxis protein methyltransferase CheR